MTHNVVIFFLRTLKSTLINSYEVTSKKYGEHTPSVGESASNQALPGRRWGPRMTCKDLRLTMVDWAWNFLRIFSSNGVGQHR